MRAKGSAEVEQNEGSQRFAVTNRAKKQIDKHETRRGSSLKKGEENKTKGFLATEPGLQ